MLPILGNPKGVSVIGFFQLCSLFLHLKNAHIYIYILYFWLILVDLIWLMTLCNLPIRSTIPHNGYDSTELSSFFNRLFKFSFACKWIVVASHESHNVKLFFWNKVRSFYEEQTYIKFLKFYSNKFNSKNIIAQFSATILHINNVTI